jgi:hypothetical protein
MATEQSACPAPPPTTTAVSAACLTSHRESPHPTSLALTTAKFPRAQTRNHPRRPEPNMDDAQTPSRTTAPPDRGTSDSHDTSPGTSLRACSADQQNCHPTRSPETQELAVMRSSSPEIRTQRLPLARREVRLCEPRRLGGTAESTVRA